MFKLLNYSLVILGLTNCALAAKHTDTMLPVSPPTATVSIPVQQGSWSVGIEGLYLEPVNGDFNYAIGDIFVNTIELVPEIIYETSKIHAVDPDHAWGWLVDLTYHFPGNGSDVQVAWMHMHDKSSQHTNRQAGTRLFGIPFPTNAMVAGATTFRPIVPQNQQFPPTFLAGWDSATAKVNNDLNAVDLVFGQKLEFLQRVHMRLFGGLRYTNIQEKHHAQYSAVDENLADEADFFARSDYKGVGPRAGSDINIVLTKHFGLVGNVAASMLVGNLDNKISVSASSIVLATGDMDIRHTRVDTSKHRRIAPQWDARLGLRFKCDSRSNKQFMAEAGYQTINYYDVTDASLVSYADTMSHDNDYALRGPYMRIQMDVA